MPAHLVVVVHAVSEKNRFLSGASLFGSCRGSLILCRGRVVFCRGPSCLVLVGV